MKKTVEGDDASAEKLAEKAKATNQQAVEDVLQELDEDASSEHDPQKIKEDLGRDADAVGPFYDFPHRPFNAKAGRGVGSRPWDYLIPSVAESVHK